jgi:RecA-family ATPase
MLKGANATVDTADVREFLYTIAAQARAALAAIDKPGLLQLSRLHPSSETIVPSRFVLADVELMVAAAITDCEAGHNVYLEGRTVREGLRGNERGKLSDTVAVFALVIDSDADKGMGWDPTVRVSMTVETSPGNFQFWFFLREAIDPELADKLGKRIRAAINSDHDTGNPTQPYRVAGTVNYPSPKKIARGRITVPTALVVLDPGALWTPEAIEQHFPLPEQTKSDDYRAADVEADETDIPVDTMRVICDGVADGRDRSHAFFNVIVALKRLGFPAQRILELLERHPDGIAKKYEGRLHQEIERVYSKIKGGPQQGAQPQSPPLEPEFSAQELGTMTFPPIKWVLPEILCEGLTLLASKPKIGKSWLLLHAAIAIATGGFTLGELHCIQGDVLYCALEDGKRRLRSRMDKLGLGWPERLTFRCQLPKLNMGGLDVIRTWIMAHPQARLIIIDILAMVRESRKHEDTTYDADYQAVLELRNLAIEFGIAVVVVHHLRKAEADDAFDTVSGTLGLTGAPDSVLIIKRDATGKCVLHGKGRDLVEIEKAITFERASCMWRIEGDATEIRHSTERQVVLNAIEEAGAPVGPNDIARETGMKAVNIRFLLGKLVKEGVIEKAKTYGKYQRKV